MFFPQLGSNTTVVALAMPSSSTPKPAKIHFVVAFYDISWDNARFRRAAHHEKTLAKDIKKALESFDADVVLLCECGEVGTGLDRK